MKLVYPNLIISYRYHQEMDGGEAWPQEEEENGRGGTSTVYLTPSRADHLTATVRTFSSLLSLSQLLLLLLFVR